MGVGGNITDGRTRPTPSAPPMPPKFGVVPMVRPPPVYLGTSKALPLFVAHPPKFQRSGISWWHLVAA